MLYKFILSCILSGHFVFQLKKWIHLVFTYSYNEGRKDSARQWILMPGIFCFLFKSFSTKQLESVSFLDSDGALDSFFLNNKLLHFLGFIKFFFLSGLFTVKICFFISVVLKSIFFTPLMANNKLTDKKDYLSNN